MSLLAWMADASWPGLCALHRGVFRCKSRRTSAACGSGQSDHCMDGGYSLLPRGGHGPRASRSPYYSRTLSALLRYGPAPVSGLSQRPELSSYYSARTSLPHRRGASTGLLTRLVARWCRGCHRATAYCFAWHALRARSHQPCVLVEARTADTHIWRQQNDVVWTRR